MVENIWLLHNLSNAAGETRAISCLQGVLEEQGAIAAALPASEAYIADIADGVRHLAQEVTLNFVSPLDGALDSARSPQFWCIGTAMLANFEQVHAVARCGIKTASRPDSPFSQGLYLLEHSQCN